MARRGFAALHRAGWCARIGSTGGGGLLVFCAVRFVVRLGIKFSWKGLCSGVRAYIYTDIHTSGHAVAARCMRRGIRQVTSLDSVSRFLQDLIAGMIYIAASMHLRHCKSNFMKSVQLKNLDALLRSS